MTAGRIPAREITLDCGELKRRLGDDYTETLEKYKSAQEEILSAITVRYAIGDARLTVSGDTAVIGDVRIKSQAIVRHLSRYEICAVVALTLGVDADRLIKRYEAKGETLGFVADALLSVIADSACLKICGESFPFEHSAPFAPGYADTDTKHLPSLLKIADQKGALGITFTDSYLMIPTKSIVVIVGKM